MTALAEVVYKDHVVLEGTALVLDVLDSAVVRIQTGPSSHRCDIYNYVT